MFRSLDDVLKAVKAQPTWQDFRQLEILQKRWPTIVGKAVARNTRPLRIYRDTLHVATSSPTWAQNLAFQRALLVEKLNPHLSRPIKEIRFRPAEWHQGKRDDRTAVPTSSISRPSTAPNPLDPQPPKKPSHAGSSGSSKSKRKLARSPVPPVDDPALPKNSITITSVVSVSEKTLKEFSEILSGTGIVAL